MGSKKTLPVGMPERSRNITPVATERDPRSATSMSSSDVLRRAIRLCLTAAMPGVALMSGAIQANPQQGVVVAGSATVNSKSPGQLEIDQSSSRAVINWGTFSIASGEQVTFVQPNASSATLNRVVGGSQSVIDGILTANGQVLILNSAGVLFSKNAQVNVGGLIATTSDIADGDFLHGRFDFHGSAAKGASVVNEGSIRVADQGLAALVAPTVRNSGLIQARLGRIALASGDTFTIDLYGDHLINFAVSSHPATPGTVQQSGTLVADGGRVELTSDAAAGIVGSVINMSGLIQARSVSQSANGAIVLEGAGGAVNVSGVLDASGASPGTSGGSVSVTGATVALSSHAFVDASGSDAGGSISLGRAIAGSHESQTSSLQIDSGALIDARAVNSGSGGNVSLWGAKSVAFDGAIDARGGAAGGDGGRVDVSTEGGLGFDGRVTLSASGGTSGTLLLDPANITVAALGSSNPNASVVSASSLDQILRTGTNVELSATDSISVIATIDGRPLAGASAAAPSGGVSLTAGSLFIAAPIVTDRGAISLTASTGSIAFGSSGVNDGFLWVSDSTNVIPVGSAAITLRTATGVGTTGALPSNSIGQLVTQGAITIDGGSGSVTDLPALNGYAGSAGIGPLTVTTGGEINLSGARSTGAINLSGSSITVGKSPLYSATGGILINGGAGGIVVNAATTDGTSSGTSAPAIQAAGGGNVSLVTSGAVALNSSVIADGNLCVGGSQLASCGAPATTAAAASGPITMASGTTLQAGSAMGAKEISIITSGDALLQSLLLGSQGALNVNAGGKVSVADAIGGFQGVGSVGSVAITAGGDVSLAGATAGVVDGPAANSATISINSGGSVSVTAAPLVARDGITIEATGPASAIMIGATPSATAGLVAGFGLTSGATPFVDTTQVLNAAAAVDVSGPAAVTFNQGALAAGAINIGTSTSRVASVSQASSAVLQAGASKTTNGTISIFASGPIAASNLLVGESGSVTLDSNGGNVVVASPLTGFIGSRGIGALSVSNAQNVTLNGATVGESAAEAAGAGTLSITALGTVTTASAPLISRDGINISAGSNVIIGSGSGLVAGFAPGTAATTNAAATITIGTTTPADVTFHADVLGAGGVSVGSATNRVASLLSTGATIQAGDASATSAGGIAIYANRSVDVGAVQLGAAGALIVDTHDADATTAGTVSFEAGIAGLGTGSQIGRLQIDADGTITLPAVKTAGDIALTTYSSTAGLSAATTAPGTLEAGTDVKITMAGGSIALATPTGATTSSITADTGAVVIAGAGTVTIPGLIVAGTGVRVGSLQENGTPVALANGALDGLAQSIIVGGVHANTLSNAGLSPIVLAASGPVSVGGPIFSSATGSVWIEGGTVTTQAIVGEGPAQTGSTPAAVGDIILEGCITSATCTPLAAGLGNVTVLGPLESTQSISILTKPSGSVALDASIDAQGGNVVIGSGTFATNVATSAPVLGDAANETIYLSNNIQANGTGNITFAGNVLLFYGVDRWTADPALFVSATGLYGTATDSTGTPNAPHTTDALQAVDANGVPLANQHRPAGDTSLCPYFACPTQQGLASFYPANTLPTVLDGYLSANASDAAGLANALGSLTATVSGSGTLSFLGSVSRYVPNTIPAPLPATNTVAPNANACPNGCDFNVISVLPTFLNVQLVTTGSSVIFNGPVGDSAHSASSVISQNVAVLNPTTSVGATFPQTVPVFLNPYGLPSLGTFIVNTTGSPQTICQALCASTASYLFNPSINALDTNATTPNNLYANWTVANGGSGPTTIGVYYKFDDTNQGNQDIGVIPGAIPQLLGTQASITPTTFGALGATQQSVNAATGVTGATGAVAGIAGVALTAGGLDGTSLSVSDSESSTLDGTATLDARRTVDSSPDLVTVTADDLCPRGAGRTADFGFGRGVDGASPNVFARCARPQ
jgi:filamentous hemagglutinin family protein